MRGLIKREMKKKLFIIFVLSILHGKAFAFYENNLNRFMLNG